MMTDDITGLLKSVTDPSGILVDEYMSKHTTFRIGGRADYFVTPRSIKEATDTVRLLLAHDIPFTVIGNGSNLLVSDSGYRGVILCLENGCGNISVDGTKITAGAGAMLTRVAKAAYDNSLTGLEFASGIPGSVGGAIVMNAGAYGGQMEDVVTSVTVFDTETGRMESIDNEAMEFGYRTSIIKKHPYIVLEAQMELSPGNADEIKAVTDDLAVRRRTKQPLEYPSAGSTFKRPEGYFAGKLIEDAKLKGFAIGGAAVSEKHCGFVINRGGATAGDVIELIKIIRSKVSEQFNVLLEPEIVMIGEGMEI